MSRIQPRLRLDDLLPLVYEQLQQYASRALDNEPAGLTLQTTDLVHEVYLRLSQLKEIQWTSDHELMRTAIGVMRRVLVDHARKRRSLKRTAPGTKLDITGPSEPADLSGSASQSVIDLFDLDDALNRLEEFDPRKAEIVQMRYFGGLAVEEVAAALEVSPATVKRDWTLAKAWLYRELHVSEQTENRQYENR